MPAMGAVEWALLLALSALWGGSFFFVGVAVGAMPPFTIVLVRVALAAAALILVVHVSGMRLPASLRQWASFAVMGALNNAIPFSLIVWGQTQIASGLAAILNATTPLFTVVLAHVLTRDERLTPNRAAGVLVGFAGVALMIGLPVLEGVGTHLGAQLAVLAAAMSYALAGIFGRRFRALPPAVTAAGQVSASTLMLLPVALVLDRPWTLPLPAPQALGALAGLALLSTALAYVIYFRVLRAAGATNLLLVTFLIPASALMLGSLVLNERLEPRHFAGMALIGLGLAAIDGRPALLLKAGFTRARRA
jgi:drug/metabolite transporter (DMT)-like permease